MVDLLEVDWHNAAPSNVAEEQICVCILPAEPVYVPATSQHYQQTKVSFIQVYGPATEMAQVPPEE